MGHRSRECDNGFPKSIFVVMQAYIDTFKKKDSKAKAVAAVFDRSRGRDRSSCSDRLSGDHTSRRSASPHRAPSRQSRRSPSPRCYSRQSLNTCTGPSSRRSPSVESLCTEGVEREFGSRMSSSPERPAHPVAAVLGTSENPVAYMASNKDDVLSSGEDTDSFDQSVNASKVRPLVAAIVPKSRTEKVVKELKAPLHVDHLYWRCAISGGSTDGTLVPVYDALIDHGGP